MFSLQFLIFAINNSFVSFIKTQYVESPASANLENNIRTHLKSQRITYRQYCSATRSVIRLGTDIISELSNYPKLRLIAPYSTKKVQRKNLIVYFIDLLVRQFFQREIMENPMTVFFASCNLCKQGLNCVSSKFSGLRNIAQSLLEYISKTSILFIKMA